LFFLFFFFFFFFFSDFFDLSLDELLLLLLDDDEELEDDLDLFSGTSCFGGSTIGAGYFCPLAGAYLTFLTGGYELRKAASAAALALASA